jgi:quinol monooxygenase YgiN
MNVIVAGTVRVPPANIARIKPAMDRMLAASRAEDGCIAYSYAVDVQDPGLVRIFEVWRDQAALEAHFRTPHMAEWRSAGAGLELSDRKLFLYQIASERPL